MKKLVLIFLLALGLVVAACQSPPGVARVGEVAPDFRLSSLDGRAVRLSDLRGTPVLLNFWATWCDPCRYEMPLLQEVHEAWSGKLAVVAVDMGESGVAVRQFVETGKLTFTVVIDSDGSVADQYDVRAVPLTVFIDKQGVIQAMRLGAFPARAAIEENLAKIMP